ncbi:MAG: 50S ribosomal protein L18 [Flammeovirgaceae bacterium]|nr:50S ribosomal protein L18 [Flammeovirgaceae bacterium]MDW8288505.1 50S ribosomal protein L18 [Flammeovirgaceae bacterium]
MVSKKVARRLKIKRRIRKVISGSAQRPRLSVFKSNTSVYVQLIDDTKGNTLVAVHSKEVSSTSNATVAVSKEVGKKLAQKALAMGINTVVFDRNGYLYHGKVKAVAEGAREGGLKF